MSERRLTLEEARRHVGDGVVYVPLHGPREDGVITSVSDSPGGFVFVRYASQHPGAAGRATRPGDLVLTFDGSTSGEATVVGVRAADPADGVFVTVVTRYGGHRHAARRADSRGLEFRDRWQTLCLGTSAWTLESWEANNDHPLELTIEAMRELPECERCIERIAAGVY